MTMLPTAVTVVLVLCWMTDALHSYRMMTMPIYLNAGSIKSSSLIYMSDAPKNKKKVILWMHRLIH